jgi:hypothetical protein
MIDNLISLWISIFGGIIGTILISNMTPRASQIANKIVLWTVWSLVCITIGAGFPSCTSTSKLESQVRQWAENYPADLRDRWGSM